MLRGTVIPALIAASLGCSVKWQVLQPRDLERVCSAVVVPIGTNAVQNEYLQTYLPQFQKAFRERFGAKIRVVDWSGDRKGLTWEEAVPVGQTLGVDAVVGLLIDDSDRPPRRMEILNVVKTSNGKALARQNRLIPPVERYGFESELKDLGRSLKCQP